NLLLVREGGLRLYGSAISNRQGYLFVRLVTVFNKLSRKEGTGIKRLEIAATQAKPTFVGYNP
ncbi:hypothetical protein MEO43_06940, partial [Dolichospermum sp. ST_sed5]|nr:hypothetical protein [Dolichospermum sp. ST_sed5]